MAATRFAFGAADWRPGGHPLEQKKTPVVGRAVALLRFEPGFEDPNPCERSHVIYVLEGSLELGLEGEALVIERGNACVIDAGTAHRARNPGPSPCVLFVVSEVDVG